MEYNLWLLQLLGAGNMKIAEFKNRYGSAKEAYEAIALDKDIRFLSPAEKKRISSASVENSEKIIETCEKNKISVLQIEDEDYPNSIRCMDDAPPILFYKGNLSGINNEILISGVGSRNPTEYTVKVTSRTCRDLAKIGVILVSGMANGVDHIVHNASVSVKERTIGVLACGMLIDYPRGSSAFRERIYEYGGACVSELFPYSEPSRSYFQVRNRIISGISFGVMIFQAGIKSGSLLTADHALRQGHDVFCVPPHDLFAPEYAGVVGLLRDGAVPLFNYLDIVNYYYSDFANFADYPKKKSADSENEEEEKEEKEEGSESKAVSAPEPTVKKEKTEKRKTAAEAAAERYNIEEAGEGQKAIFNCLSQGGEKTLEEITEICKISSDDASLYILDLEIAGIIDKMPGSKYSLKE